MEHSPQSEPKTAPPTGVVVIGDENSVEPYLRALGRLDGVRVAGVLDGSTERAHASFPSTADPATGVEWAGADAFVHCGPLRNAPETVAVVAATGKPMFVDSRGGRYRADARTVRACIEAGEIGRVVFARFAVGAHAVATASGGDELPWQRRRHVLDILGWWIGTTPDTVYAQRTVDYESVTLRYADGATAVCDLSSAGPSYREVVVVGTSGSMSLTWADHVSVLLTADGTGVRYTDGSHSLEAMLDGWLAHVRTGDAPTVDPSELAAAIALGDAVERSIASGLIAHASASPADGGRT